MAEQKKKKPVTLKNGAKAHQLTREDRVKGAKKSAITQRRNRLLKDLAIELLNSESPKGVKKSIEKMGYNDTTNGMAIMVGQLKEAIDGSTRAAEFIRDTAGQKPKDEIETSAPIQLTINRRSEKKDGDKS